MQTNPIEATATARIKEAHTIAQSMGNDLVLAYSGGKDSDVLLRLALKSGVPFRAEHNHTTVDAPETVCHIRAVFAELAAKGIPTVINWPPDIVTVDGKTTRASMWNLIPKKLMPPTRLVRYCCKYFKERRFEGQHLLLGVRWAESRNRKGRGIHETIEGDKSQRIIYADDNDDRRKLTEICFARNTVATNPIIDWMNEDVWGYIKTEGTTMNPLYARGFKRVGCIGCPMAGGHFQRREFNLYPKYRDAYVRAFDRMVERKKELNAKHGYDGELAWTDGETVMRWWTDPRYDPNQLELHSEESGRGQC